MMIKIYSKVQPGLLLHQVFHRSDAKRGREDIVHPDNFIQCASLVFDKGTTFKPHIHRYNERSWNVISQESWIVLKGSVMCHFYDIDGKHIQDEQLNVGDASFTLAGAHTYTILEDDSQIMEYKTGKYLGQENDKVML
jgi:hypothetical protein